MNDPGFQYNLESLHSIGASSQCILQAEEKSSKLKMFLAWFHVLQRNYHVIRSNAKICTSYLKIKINMSGILLQSQFDPHNGILCVFIAVCTLTRSHGAIQQKS